jgi:VWFA-related protein
MALQLRRPLAGLAALSCAMAVAAPALLGQETRGARERAVYVTVTGEDGLPVAGLSPREFVVREDGRRREVLFAATATEPVTIALMVDNSTAAEPFLADIRRALEAFVKRVGGKHPTAVTTIGDRPTIAADYTLDTGALVNAVQRIFPQPGSAAYFVEGLTELSRGLMARDFERAVIVAVTTEGPEFSERHYNEALELLEESGASLEAFVLTTGGGPDMREEGSRSRAVLLDRGARESGGERHELLTSMALEGALEKLVARLEGQYKVVYSRPESLVPPEKIEVGVTREGLDARGTPARERR